MWMHWINQRWAQTSQKTVRFYILSYFRSWCIAHSFKSMQWAHPCDFQPTHTACLSWISTYSKFPSILVHSKFPPILVHLSNGSFFFSFSSQPRRLGPKRAHTCGKRKPTWEPTHVGSEASTSDKSGLSRDQTLDSRIRSWVTKRASPRSSSNRLFTC